MCGLVGAVGEIYASEKKALKHLLWFDTVRGKHSTGVAAIKYDNTVGLYKEVGTPVDLYRKFPKNFNVTDDTITDFALKVVIGHNRFATMGAHTADNAHPFTHGDITGAHNGTLRSQYLNRLDNYRDFAVDSEAVFFNINKNGLKKTINNMCGAWALTYYDKSTQRMHFIRNKERPLFFVWTKDRKTLFWASEKWMLEAALSLAKVEFEQIFGFRSDIHYYMEVGDKGSFTKDAKLTFEEEPIEGFTPPVTVVTHYNGYGHGSQTSRSNQNLYTPTYMSEGKKKTLLQRQLMKAKIRREITVSIVGKGMSANKTEYIIAEPAEPGHDYEIRLYAHDSKWWKVLLESANIGSYHTVTIKKYIDRHTKGKNECYLLGDMRTLSKPIGWEEQFAKDIKDGKTYDWSTGSPNGSIDADGFDKRVVYRGYGNEELTYTQFREKIVGGCFWCNEPLKPEEHTEIKFFDEDSWLCPYCSNDDQINKYVR